MPIPFSVWIEGIIGSASIISDKATLERVWVEGDKSITSMVSFDEAYVQLFDDLDADGYIDVHTNDASLSAEQRSAVREYIKAFKEFDDRPYVVKGQHKVQALLASPSWERVMQKAQRLVSLF